MGRRIVRAGLAAGAALLLAGCGGGTDPADAAGSGGASGGGKNGGGEAGPAGGGDPRTASLAQPDTLTVSFCHTIPSGDGGEVYGLTLRSFSAKDGAFVGERSTVLPADVEPTAGCEEDGPGHGVGTAFNKDLTLVAGIVSASTDRAAAFDLATGKELAPPDPDSFAKRPKNNGAAFHPVTGRLWYDMQHHDFESDDPVASRDPKGGPKTEETVPFEKLPDLLGTDGPTATTILATDGIHGPAVPRGGIVAGYSMGAGVHLNRVDRDGDVGAGSFLTDIETKGLDGTSLNCRPSFWRDATTLVCEFKQITFTADYAKVVKTEDLIPENDRTNLPPVLSPDGKSFAFLSKGENDRWGLFRGDFSGAEPVKITDVDPPIDGSDEHRESLVRWN
ncbi:MULTISPECIES: hypothetical protein [Streptomyces]|uniref:hypothetical protein n=1 Tax=Streptomyces TaxID=1883 RepID=UPI0013160D80|nr:MULTISPECIES: hypothetical protein [Streptomyces]QGZ49479.1 hypothetical protein GPZ77_14820 [Streptomyces sp. QHH-9511]GGU09192.1 hypothetical protein GCM10010272_62860 [Streptomyces lateritius]